MKLIEGKTLLQLLKAEPPVSSQRWIDIFTNACQAMAYAHDEGIIHRDLTPSNIMVGPFGEVQIMDWGLAKDLAKQESHQLAEDAIPVETPGYVTAPKVHVDPTCVTKMDMETTRVGSVFGTLAYLSPEQALGQVDRIDKRSDVFSLGAILCRLLTGVPPYHNQDQEGLLASAQKGDINQAILRLSQAKNRLLAELAIRCLSIDPDSRPKDAGAIVEMLERIQVVTQRRKTILTSLSLTTLIAILLALSYFRPASSVSSSQLPPSDHKPVAMVTDPEAIYSLLKAGQDDLGLSSYRAALDKQPSNMKLHFVIGTALLRAQRLKDAEEVAKQLLYLDTQNPEHHFLLADVLYQQGRFQDSLESATKAKVQRDQGTSTRLPIDERIGELQRSIAILNRIDASPEPSSPECTPNEYFDFGKVFDLKNNIELATKFYRMGLAEQKNPRERSVKMFLLHNYFIQRKLLRPDITPKQRDSICRVGVEWAKSQLGLVGSAFELNGDSTDSEAIRMKGELVRELQSGSTFQFLNDMSNDLSIDLELKLEANEVLSEIGKL